MARTQKNKATALHLGLLKARLAKLRRELITPKGGGGATGEGKLYFEQHFSHIHCKITILGVHGNLTFITGLFFIKIRYYSIIFNL